MTEPTRRIVGAFDGREVEEVVLSSPTGVRISILTYGALIRDWRVPLGGRERSVVLGFDQFEPYPKHSPYFGAIAGRVANRTAGGRFVLDGTVYALPANEGRNHLHGGPQGIGERNWAIERCDGQSVRLTLQSADGDMGYPGNLDIAVTYSLAGNRLDILFEAMTDAPTPVNIVQHNYFNLMGEGDILDHTLRLAAGAYTVVDEEQIPTGEIRPVAGSDLDFRAGRTMRDRAGNPVDCDFNFALDTRRAAAAPVAVLAAPDRSLTLSLFTDQPGLQVYNACKLDVPVPGLGGRNYPRYAGLCLEDQGFPDAMNNPHFPSPVISPERPYRHHCAIEIA
ncbi:MAG: aldose epimerase family protein [Tropicimonas sp.]|uniref:aldose epimerase family protein n=1 Tax=Tropicimonas sp. TaxID=2067044 RepID=UPI003A8732C6